MQNTSGAAFLSHSESTGNPAVIKLTLNVATFIPGLCLLHAKHVRSGFFKPLGKNGKPRRHQINVERGDLHTGSMWTKAFSMAFILPIALSTSFEMACESKVERYFGTSMCISTCMNGPM